MKIIIAAVASLAFATSAIAAVPSTPTEKKPTVKTAGQVELAWGKNRSGQTTDIVRQVLERQDLSLIQPNAKRAAAAALNFGNMRLWREAVTSSPRPPRVSPLTVGSPVKFP